MLEVRLLGGLSAVVGGHPVVLPADARARELLARLALSPGPQPRSAMAGRLRPDVSEDSARKTLRSALYELRRALGDEGGAALEVSAQQLALTDAARVDVREFRRLLADGELAAAVEAGAGELLAGYDADWALRAREEHVADLTGALATLATEAEAAGDLAAAANWARRRVEADPLAEAAARELIRLLARADDRPAALAVASALGERLRRELGVPPSAATRALVDEVRGGGLAAPAAAPRLELPQALAAAARPVGRDALVQRVVDAWTAAGAGGLRCLLLAGPAGIGKTTVAGEAARRVGAAGGAVLLGRSAEHALVGFEPWVEALEPLLAGLPDADDWLGRHDSALSRLLPTRSPDDAAPGAPRDRYLAFDVVRDLLERVTAAQPLLLVLDDIHWADADSIALLRHVVRTALRARMLCVLCARSDELGPDAAELLAGLRREPGFAQLDLAGLDLEAVAEVVAAHDPQAGDAGVRRYLDRSGGNPFFLNELLRADSDAPPAGVREMVARRMASLPQDARDTLDFAAACGRGFEARTIAVAAKRPAEEVLGDLDAALSAALISPSADPGRFEFAHALVSETVLADMPLARRARVHARLAQVLAADDRRPPGEVVRHLRAAGPLADAEQLANWELAAAHEAGARLAHTEAAAHFEAALAARGGAEVWRGEVLLALGAARDRAGDRVAAREAFREAAAIAAATDSADGVARAALGYGGVAFRVSRPDPTAVELLERALAATPEADRATTARLRARLSVELHVEQPERASELSERALADARASGAAEALLAALNARRVSLWRPDAMAERRSIGEEAVAVAMAAGDREAELQARQWRMVDLSEHGWFDVAGRELARYEELADRIGLPHFRWYVPLWKAGYAIGQGRWADVPREQEEAERLGTQADDPEMPMLLGIQRAITLDLQYRQAEIDRDWVRRSADRSPAPWAWWTWLASLAAKLGERDEAQRWLDRSMAAGPRMDLNWHCVCELAEAAADLGDREAAARIFELLEPHAELFAVVGRAVAPYSNTELHLGRLAATLGRLEEAEERLRRALAANEKRGAEPFVAVTWHRLGEVLVERGDAEAGRGALEEAARRGERLGMGAFGRPL